MEKVGVYTAIYGQYDVLKRPPDVPGIDYVCFTDDAELRSQEWRIEVRNPRYPHPRLAAKWFKMNSHRAMPTYRHTIWVDASLRILSASFATEMLSFLNASGLALFRHPDRNNVMDEATVSSTMPKYEDLRLLEQVEHYRSRGFASQNGLFAATTLVRDNRNRSIRRLNRRWMRENIHWTYQDQLSLPYLLWKFDLEPGIVPYNLWDNHLFTWHHHASEF